MNRNTKYLRCVISIHSARVGGDLNCKALFHPLKNFNPLRPCGRRQQGNVRLHLAIKISIHSARVGGDSSELSSKCNSSIFQSTPPVWAETAKETIFSSLKHLYYNIFYRKKQENSM